MSAPVRPETTSDTHLHLAARFVVTVLAVTWAFGRSAPSHPDASRDISLNFTTIYVAVTGILPGHASWQQRHTT